jgi:hypothetical protein
MRTLTLPLRERLADPDEWFGIGMYVPAELARRLGDSRNRRDLAKLAHFLAEHRLDPFTFNAFPAGGFHREGLKEGVFQPTWLEEERVRFTLDVAQVAAGLVRALRQGSSHVSISTHTGGFGPWPRGDVDARRCARNLVRVAQGLLRLGLDTGPRYLLALEAEPRAAAGDSAALAAFLERVPEWGGGEVEPWVIARGLGTCLDACHSAVEFEDPREAFALATQHGALAKFQLSSALALAKPAAHPRGIQQLLAMNEPRYLHQVTGQGLVSRCEVADLPELERALAGAGRENWLGSGEWRCHFQVPVDLTSVGDSGLATTRDHAGALLGAALAEPKRWGVEELHLEIETYTWDVLPGAVRGAGEIVDGLQREYEHAMGLLRAAGWSRDVDPAS